MERTVELLRSALGEDRVLLQESMNKHTTFRIGGPADVFAAPGSVTEVKRVIEICRRQGMPFYVIGNGSNLLVSDLGYRGVIVQLYRNLSEITVDGTMVTAQAGAMLSAIARRAQAAGLAGFEFASGIPGTVGGAVVMNAGAYGGELKDVLEEATVLTAEGEVETVGCEALKLGYRSSAVAGNGWIVLGVKLRLERGEPEEIGRRMEELKAQRVAKQPLDLPSAGSTFKRPAGNFAGKLIMEAGLRGFSVGGAQVSEKHCGFVVNRGGATAADVYRLIEAVTDRVRGQSGVTLEPEVRLLGEFSCEA